MNVNFGLFPPIEERASRRDGKRLRGPERGRRAQARAVGAGGGGSGGVDRGERVAFSCLIDGRGAIPSAVMAGLDPAIQARAPAYRVSMTTQRRFDGRVKPGHDERKCSALQSATSAASINLSCGFSRPP